MKKNTITVFIGIDHYTDFNRFLDSMLQITQQNNSGFKVEVVGITTPQIPDQLNAMYMNIEDIKSRFPAWPEWLSYVCYKSDDNSYNKVLNYVENEAKGEIGELCTFKSVAPIIWFPNHLSIHWDEYKRERKSCGWMISRLEIKDLSRKDDEKNNTIAFRLDDFPDHIDKIVLDEIFITYPVLIACDFNKAAVLTEIDGMRVAIFHAGKFLVDMVKSVSDSMKLKGFNPKEMTVQQWIDLQAIKENQKAQTEVEQHLEDGSVVFAETEDDGAVIFSEEN